MEFGQEELVKASLKEAGWPDLRETSPEFQKFWDGVKGAYEPAELPKAEMMAWRAWQAAEVNALANATAQVKI